MKMLKSLLFVSTTGDMWGSIPEDETIVVKSLKIAKIKLLEKDFENLIIGDISSEEQQHELISFVENLKAHPRLSSLQVYVAKDMVQTSESETILSSFQAVIVPGAEYFLDHEEVDSSNSFQEVFDDLKNKSAKSLALLKIEHSTDPEDLSHKQIVIKRFLEILNEEISS